MSDVLFGGISGRALHKATLLVRLAEANGMLSPHAEVDLDVYHQPYCVALLDQRRPCNCDAIINFREILLPPGSRMLN